VTFDECYRNNAEVALPILSRQRIPATFFVADDLLYGRPMWNDVVIDSIRGQPLPDMLSTTLELLTILSDTGMRGCDRAVSNLRAAAGLKRPLRISFAKATGALYFTRKGVLEMVEEAISKRLVVLAFTKLPSKLPDAPAPEYRNVNRCFL
jgi:hypothetical protein